MRGWGQMCGWSDTAMQAMPFFFGMLSIVIAFVAGSCLFTHYGGTIAALLVAIWLRPLASTSAMVRPYSLRLPLLNGRLLSLSCDHFRFVETMVRLCPANGGDGIFPQLVPARFRGDTAVATSYLVAAGCGGVSAI